MNANRSRYLPPSEADDLEATAETPEETLEELEARADTVDEIFQSQSDVAEGRTRGIRNNLAKYGITPSMERIIELQECILSMVKTHYLCLKVRKELAEKRDEELKETFTCRTCKTEKTMNEISIKHTAGDFECIDCYARSLDP